MLKTGSSPHTDIWVPKPHIHNNLEFTDLQNLVYKLSGYCTKLSVTSQNCHVFRERKDIQKLQILWTIQPLFFHDATDGASSLLRRHDHIQTRHTR